MNDYQGLAERLLQRGMGQSQPQQPSMPYDQMRKYLQTAAGREAARAAIDRVIVDNKLMGKVPPVVHQQIFQTIQGIMSQPQRMTGFNPVVDQLGQQQQDMRQMPMPQAQPPDMTQEQPGDQLLGL